MPSPENRQAAPGPRPLDGVLVAALDAQGAGLRREFGAAAAGPQPEEARREAA